MLPSLSFPLYLRLSLSFVFFSFSPSPQHSSPRLDTDPKYITTPTTHNPSITSPIRALALFIPLRSQISLISFALPPPTEDGILSVDSVPYNSVHISLFFSRRSFLPRDSTREGHDFFLPSLPIPSPLSWFHFPGLVFLFFTFLCYKSSIIDVARTSCSPSSPSSSSFPSPSSSS